MTRRSVSPLGDIVFDDLSVMEPLNQAIALIGLPWYNVIGNHDLNMDAPNDELSDETFERFYGPAYYSFDHGTGALCGLGRRGLACSHRDRTGTLRRRLGRTANGIHPQ